MTPQQSKYLKKGKVNNSEKRKGQVKGKSTEKKVVVEGKKTHQ